MIVDYRGQLLAAHPANPADIEKHAVMLIITQTKEFALGVKLNRIIDDHDVSKICQNLDIWYDGDDPVYHGGRVSPDRIHVIHTLDWTGFTTIQLNDDIGVTNDISILTALSVGEGPEYFRACAGHHVWNHGLLNRQMDTKTYPDETHRWEVAPATIDNVFKYSGSEQWRHALTESAKIQASAWF